MLINKGLAIQYCIYSRDNDLWNKLNHRIKYYDSNSFSTNKGYSIFSDYDCSSNSLLWNALQ